MTRALYTLVLALAAPAFWLGLWRRSRREGGDWEILGRQRFGRYDTPPALTRPVWVHAVSLGEARAAKPFVDALLGAGCDVLLTHTTATARAESARLFADALAAGRLVQAWLPYDFPGAMRRFLRQHQPRCGLLIEREVWPNLMAAAEAQAVPIALVSARLSARSAAGMRRLAMVMRPAFARLAVVLAQTEADAARLLEVGARETRVMGNLKFDVELPPELVARGREWRAAWGRAAVVIASTREGEEARFIAAVRALAAVPGDALFVLVPRHAQRFSQVAAMLDAAGMPWLRRSALPDPGAVPREVRWVLGDSLGEMAAYYGAADVAVVAGSFEDFGGHNLVEATAAGVPVIVGPHTRNFAQAVDDAVEEGAAVRAADVDAAITEACGIISDSARAGAMAQAATRFVAAHRGATRRAIAALDRWL